MGEREPIALDSTITTGGEAAAPAPRPGGTRYVIEGEIGRGGIGVVLRARDRQLDRTVALKVPLRDTDAARLTAEAAITARLEHPSITPIYEAGRLPSGEPFYAMKLVEGRSLRELLDGAATLEARLALLPHVIAVAEALAYAHAHAVIHRDVKPSNVLVGSLNETIVVDWGLAIAVDGPIAPSGIVGTPAYMAPEQARGEAVDRRSDVYALGAMLYHLLRGRPPFGGRDALARAAAGPPDDVRRHAQGTPPDLAAVLEKAMAAAPSQRYADARELAADLRRFLLGQLVSSRRYRWWELVLRWSRRHVVSLSVAASLVAALLATGVVSVRRIAREQAQARRRYNEMVLAQARSAVERDPTEALGWLGRYPADGADWAAARTLMAEADSSGAARAVYRGMLWAALSPDGARVAVLDVDGNAWLSDGSAVHRLWRQQIGAGLIAFSPDGGEIVAATAQALWRWDVRRDVALPPLPGLGAAYDRELRWSRDGRYVVAAAGNDVVVWEPATGARRVLAGHASQVHSVAVSPDGRWIASGGHDHTVRLWPLDGGAARVLTGHTDQVRPVEFAPDGKALVSAGNDGTVRVWDVAGGAARTLRGPASILYQLRIVAGGKRALTSGSDGALREWDLAAGTQREVARLPQGLIGLESSGDGALAFVGAGDATVYVVDVPSGVARPLRGHEGAVVGLTLSADGKTLLTLGLDAAARVWDLSRPAPSALFAVPGPLVADVSPDGGWLAIGASDGVRACRIADRACRVLGRHDAAIRGLRFFADGERFVTASDDGSVRVWRRDGGMRVLHAGAAKINGVAVSPDGTHVAAASDDGAVLVFDADGAARERIAARHDDRAWSVAFSPDGRRVVSGGLDFVVRVADVDGGRVQVLRGHHDPVMGVTFAHDGRRVASASFDGTARLWNLADGSSRVFTGDGGSFVAVELSRDDGALVAYGNDRVARVWNLADGSVWPLAAHRGTVSLARLSPDGKSVVTLFEDGALQWSDLARRDAVVLRVPGEHIYSGQWMPDGRGLVTTTPGGHVWLWPLGAMAPPPRAPSELRALLSRLSSVTLDDFAHAVTPLVQSRP